MIRQGAPDSFVTIRNVTKNQSSFAARFFGLNVLEGASHGAAFIAFQREHAQLRTPGAPKDRAIVLPGVVRTRSFQGLVDEYAIDLEQGVSIRALDGSSGYAPGERVDVVIDERNLFLLDR